MLIGIFAGVKRVSPVSWGMWGEVNASSGLALQGYDPVAYFESEQPTPGDSQFVHEWASATWQFASVENRDLFMAIPDAYAPQFGGLG